jgi:hypothetical protein
VEEAGAFLKVPENGQNKAFTGCGKTHTLLQNLKAL